eukprot:scaffold29846_cov18-Tisochrysis_lutea.AAC.1
MPVLQLLAGMGMPVAAARVMGQRRGERLWREERLQGFATLAWCASTSCASSRVCAELPVQALLTAPCSAAAAAAAVLEQIVGSAAAVLVAPAAAAAAAVVQVVGPAAAVLCPCEAPAAHAPHSASARPAAAAAAAAISSISTFVAHVAFHQRQRAERGGQVARGCIYVCLVLAAPQGALLGHQARCQAIQGLLLDRDAQTERHIHSVTCSVGDAAYTLGSQFSAGETFAQHCMIKAARRVLACLQAGFQLTQHVPT